MLMIIKWIKILQVIWATSVFFVNSASSILSFIVGIFVIMMTSFYVVLIIQLVIDGISKGPDDDAIK